MSFKKWLADLKRKMSNYRKANPSGPVVPVPTPGQDAPAPVQGAVRWDEQQLFCGVQYHWSKVVSPDYFVEMARAHGFTGVHCEIMEMVTSGHLATEQAKQIRMLKPWAAAARKHGLILMVSSNSNDKLNAGGGMTVEIMKARIDQMRAGLGTDNILFQPMSEDDSSTTPAVRKFARDYAATVWPKRQVVGAGPYYETHSAALAIERKEWTTLLVTDNNTQRFEQMHPADYVALAKRHIAAWNSFVIYGFQQAADWMTWGEIGKAFEARRGAAPSPATPTPSDVPDAVLDARGFREGARLPSLRTIPQTQVLTGARIDGRRASFQPSNPFGEGAWLGLAWQEAGGWFWSDAEGLHAGDTSQNYANNLFPSGPKLPGRCREKSGLAHYPRIGADVYVFVANNGLSARTNLVFAGTQP